MLDKFLETQTDKIDKVILNTIDSVTQSIINFLATLVGDLLDVLAFGMTLVILYYCLRLIFFGNTEKNGILTSQKLLFSYFGLLLLRIFSTIF